LRDLEMHGLATSHRQPREVLRDMGQGLKWVFQCGFFWIKFVFVCCVRMVASFNCNLYLCGIWNNFFVLFPEMLVATSEMELQACQGMCCAV
jgi:hypothetical protein